MSTQIRALKFVVVVGILITFLAGCFLPPSSTSDEGSLQQTQMELSIQQTLIAQKATQDSLNQQKQQEQEQISSDQATQTQVAADNLAVQQAIQATETSIAATLVAQQQQPQETQPPEEITISEEPTQEPVQEPVQVLPDDLDSMMQNAKIVLFEDMVGRPATRRYVKNALDNMGLEYKDDGNAVGWLKSDLLSSTWDLVIIALEIRSNVSGEYFTYVNQALDAGSAVILEIWYMDRISRGEIANTLSRCGVEFEKNYVNTTGTVVDYINWPLPGKIDHPIFNEPNSGFQFTNVAVYWFDDLGDYIKLSGKKDDAELLMGTIATEKNTHGTLAACNGGKFIIQTNSSHDNAMEEVVPLWENMINYVLKNKLIQSQ